MLQYDVEARTWKQIGKLEQGRAYYAIAEANLVALCQPVGNLILFTNNVIDTVR